MNKIEALADAISKLNGVGDPESVCYKYRNPGLLKAYSIKRATDQHADDKGIRIFNSFVDGYRALLYDLRIKVSGQSRAGLTPESAVKELLAVFAIRVPDAAIQFLRRALQDQNIHPSTPLSFFTESK